MGSFSVAPVVAANVVAGVPQVVDREVREAHFRPSLDPTSANCRPIHERSILPTEEQAIRTGRCVLGQVVFQLRYKAGGNGDSPTARRHIS